MNIAIIGAGGWGTALALIAAERGHSVTLWTRSSERAIDLSTHRENAVYLPGIAIPPDINITSNDSDLKDNELYLFAVPSQSVREISLRLKQYIHPHSILVSASKGIERHTLKRMTEVLAETLGATPNRLVALSGPSHAEEVARGIPTVVIAASRDFNAAREVQQAFILPNFRIYSSRDLIGTELAGALKNVIAICAGILDGEGFGDNTVAALLTRGLAEIRRLGLALGADEQTFAGVAGLGDLVVTCLSKHSRNRRVGIAIGQGKTLDEILGSMSMVAEGVSTTESGYALAKRHGIEMPIIEATYKILFEQKDFREATVELMSREMKDDRD